MLLKHSSRGRLIGALFVCFDQDALKFAPEYGHCSAAPARIDKAKILQRVY